MRLIDGPAAETSDAEAQVTLDEVIAHIVHELRSPLTAISGYAELALQSEGQDISDFLQAIARGARELDRRISNLADDAHRGVMHEAIEARRRSAAHRGG